MCAFDNIVTSTRKCDASDASPCTHEEADTRVFLCVRNVALRGLSKVKTRTGDTDILVIAIVLSSLRGVDEFWYDFGTGKNREFYPVNVLHKKMREEGKSLLFSHYFIGCDQVSFSMHCRKKNAWNAWDNYSRVTEVFFFKLNQNPSKEKVTESLP